MSAIEPIYRSLGHRLQLARKQHRPRLTQEQVAERVGLPRSAISAIESGRQRVLAHSLIRLCEVLDVEPNVILKDLKSSDLNISQSDSELNLSTKTIVSKAIDTARLQGKI